MNLHADTAEIATFSKSPIRGLLHFIATRKTLFWLTALSGVFAHFATLAAACLGAWLVGEAISGRNERLLSISFWLAGTVSLAAFMKWYQTYISHDFGFALVETLEVGAFDGLERSSPGYVLGRRTGELAGTVIQDAGLMESFYSHLLGDYVGAAVVPFIALIAVGFIHPLFSLALSPFLPLIASIPLWLSKRAGEQGEALRAQLGDLNSEVVDGIQGLREIVLFEQGDSYLKKISTRTKTLQTFQFKYGSRSGLEQAAIDLFLSLALISVLATGIYLLNQNKIDLQALPLALVLTGAALVPITQVTQTARVLGELKAAANRILTVFHQKSHISDTGKRAHGIRDTTIEFKDVRFGYDSQRAAVLDGVSFSVAPGESVALVGKSGAGKTTCIHLLLRFWDVQSGAILIDHQDIREFSLDALRRQIAYVPQDVYLFAGSVLENIRLGRPEASLEEVERAARMAQAHEFISALPNGYETVCGERGVLLSGGQRQRIAIARAFLQDAPILIMDEAVSNLDTENERLLQEAIHKIKEGRTTILVAHRLSTIQSADRIVVIAGGKVVEDGRPKDLAERNGHYSSLLKSLASEAEAERDIDFALRPNPESRESSEFNLQRIKQREERRK